MKPNLTHDALHNPFKNRFNDPVTWRLDEMQAHSNVMRERDRTKTKSPAGRSQQEGGVFPSVFALFIVLLATVFALFRG